MLRGAVSQTVVTRDVKRGCSTGKFLVTLLGLSLLYLVVTHRAGTGLVSGGLGKSDGAVGTESSGSRLGRLWRRPPRLPPRLAPDEVGQNELRWSARQQRVKEAFLHAWSGYKKHAMGFDELMPVSHRGADGLGGFGATIVDALDTAMIMGADHMVAESGSWVKKELPGRITMKGQVNLFETTIRILGGLSSMCHLSGGNGTNSVTNGPKSAVYLGAAKVLADRLLLAFTCSPTPIPFSDVVLHDPSAHGAPGGLNSTSEVSTLQMEFNYLSNVSGDPKYGTIAMKVLEHMRTLPNVEGLVPIINKP